MIGGPLLCFCVAGGRRQVYIDSEIRARPGDRLVRHAARDPRAGLRADRVCWATYPFDPTRHDPFRETASYRLSSAASVYLPNPSHESLWSISLLRAT